MTPEPDACPRCGSTDPAKRGVFGTHWVQFCDYEWHDRPTGGLTDAVEASLRERGITIPDRPTGADDLAARLDYAAKQVGPTNAVCRCEPDDDMMVLGHHLSDAAAKLRELEAERDGLKARLNIAEGQYADRVREKAELREAGDALAAIVEDRASITPDYDALERWEQIT